MGQIARTLSAMNVPPPLVAQPHKTARYEGTREPNGKNWTLIERLEDGMAIWERQPTRTLGIWQTMMIARVLSNPTYIAQRKVKVKEGTSYNVDAPAIIDEHVFHLATERRQRPFLSDRRKRTRFWLLAGMLRCPTSARTAGISLAPILDEYKCPRGSSYNALANAPQAQRDYEAAFEREHTGEAIREVETDLALANVEAKIAEKDVERENVLRLAERGLRSLDEVERRLAEIREARALLESGRTELLCGHKRPSCDGAGRKAAVTFSRSIRRTMPKMDDAERREFLKCLQLQVTVFPKHLRIEGIANLAARPTASAKEGLGLEDHQDRNHPRQSAERSPRGTHRVDVGARAHGRGRRRSG